jgi:5,5'-dehydrodivanillate O-demethylase
MLSAEVNKQMTEVGPGTPMGDLLRRYWYPIAGLSDLKKNPTKGIRLLGEDLVLYQDRSGNLGLIESACAHRRVNMVYAIPEEHGIRCPYHGWLYDETGQCLEQPAEAPDSTFADRVQIKAYPVEVLGGAVMAYLGPLPAPLVPRWDVFVKDGCVRDIGFSTVPCNWVQIMENSLDPTHAEWLHRYFTHYIMERLGAEGTEDHFWRGRPPVRPHTKIGFDVFEHGIIKRRVLAGDDETNPNWRLGHPVLFPNILRSGNGNTMQIRVPMDDANTLYVYFSAYDIKDWEEPQRDEDVPTYKVPLPGVDDDGVPIWKLLDHNAGQDNFAWMSQGPISERWKEKLGESDRGLIVYRRMLMEQMKIVADGGEPMNVMRDPARNECIVTPFEAMEGDMWTRSAKPVYGEDAISTGNSGKYSPIRRERALRAGNPVAEIPETALNPTSASALPTPRA